MYKILVTLFNFLDVEKLSKFLREVGFPIAMCAVFTFAALHAGNMLIGRHSLFLDVMEKNITQQTKLLQWMSYNQRYFAEKIDRMENRMFPGDKNPRYPSEKDIQRYLEEDALEGRNTLELPKVLIVPPESHTETQ